MGRVPDRLDCVAEVVAGAPEADVIQYPRRREDRRVGDDHELEGELVR